MLNRARHYNYSNLTEHSRKYTRKLQYRKYRVQREYYLLYFLRGNYKIDQEEKKYIFLI